MRVSEKTSGGVLVSSATDTGRSMAIGGLRRHRSPKERTHIQPMARSTRGASSGIGQAQSGVHD